MPGLRIGAENCGIQAERNKASFKYGAGDHTKRLA
jgi:hypothetical protein